MANCCQLETTRVFLTWFHAQSQRTTPKVTWENSMQRKRPPRFSTRFTCNARGTGEVLQSGNFGPKTGRKLSPATIHSSGDIII